MKRVFGVIALIIGFAGLVGGICGLIGIIDISSGRGPIGAIGMSCAFLYVGWNWLQKKVAQ